MIIYSNAFDVYVSILVQFKNNNRNKPPLRALGPGHDRRESQGVNLTGMLRNLAAMSKRSKANFRGAKFVYKKEGGQAGRGGLAPWGGEYIV